MLGRECDFANDYGDAGVWMPDSIALSVLSSSWVPNSEEDAGETLRMIARAERFAREAQRKRKALDSMEQMD